jgi:hypothetical protein
MRDTEWEDAKGRIGGVGEVCKQSMVVSNSGPKKGWVLKGAQLAEHERGLWDKDGRVTKMVKGGKKGRGKEKETQGNQKLPKMKMILRDEPDFAAGPSQRRGFLTFWPSPLKDLHDELDMPVMFAPKFHVELQGKTERPWAHAKVGCRENCGCTMH